mmetsp:Transcript_60462/g.187635  ORF Transcript_60462/g.187635 Transcript_60462/m.187635 type:complete len:249 (-) Transcript_60462:66-812(-)
MIQADYFDKIADGQLWSFAKITKKDMSCGCKDDRKGVAGFDGVKCTMVKGASALYANVKCRGVEHSKLVQQYCPVTCDADYCGPGGASRVPPAPAPPREFQQVCEDLEPTFITITGEPATCSDLARDCQVHPFVKERCCNTCATRAESGRLSDDKKCRDHTPPGFSNERGRVYQSCSELKGLCNRSDLVPTRCCATCAKKEGDVEESCKDEPRPNLRTTSGKTFTCKGWVSHCSHPRVKEECCQTCSH